MDLKWVEDFLCLARLGSFSRAAAERHVTQSAFSRRIMSLENWLGAPLLDRGAYPVKLTDAGREFLPVAAELARHLYDAKAAARRGRKKGERTVTLAAQHSLSLHFFGAWASAIEARVGPLDFRIIADNYYGAAQSLRDGGSDFLLCFTHPEFAAMPRGVFHEVLVGSDCLIPVSASRGRRPVFALPGRQNAPVPYLAHGPDAFLGKVTDLILSRAPCFLRLCYENAFSEALKVMALAGRGVAWLPESAARENLAKGELTRVGGAKWRGRLDIRLFRAHDSTSPLCDDIWRAAGELSASL